MPTTKQKAKSKTLAAPLGRRPGCQGGAQRGGRGGTRREQYLDSPAFDHTLAARVLFLAAVPTFGYDSKQKLSLTDCPFFRSKPRRRHLCRRQRSTSHSQDEVTKG